MDDAAEGMEADGGGRSMIDGKWLGSGHILMVEFVGFLLEEAWAHCQKPFLKVLYVSYQFQKLLL